MICPPPPPPLFPYTTLFRSVADLEAGHLIGEGALEAVSNRLQGDKALGGDAALSGVDRAGLGRLLGDGNRISIGERSEEHTSELQSLRHLVCRLLLEKKKKK